MATKTSTGVWFWTIVIIVLALFGLFFLAKSGTGSNNDITAGEPAPVTVEDHVTGSQIPIVTIIAYEDFQCPACGQLQSPLDAVKAQFADKLQFVYRHFPLRSIHFNAFDAALASEAAAQQGVFWEYHDLLFASQGTWAPLGAPQAREHFVSLAETLELDLDAFRTAMESDETRERVNRDLTEGTALGVSGTPTLFLNGKIIALQRFSDLPGMIQGVIDNANGVSSQSEDQPASASQ
jgi:protein-disulfide isomerase